MKIANKDEKKAILDGLIGLFGQNRRWVLFFGTGTSCELDNRFGMPALQRHLSTKFAAEPEWAHVEAKLNAGKTLEQALSDIGLSQATKAMFRQVTGDFVASIDREYRDDLLMGKKRWVGTQLLKTLVRRLPPRNPRLSVITSNYDMLIEYACSGQRIRWTTGFVGGLARVWNWEETQDGLNQCLISKEGARGRVLMNPLPRVELFKVHGSINRFTVGSQQVECDLWTDKVPKDVERDVAVPGDPKFEQYAVSNMDTVSHAARVEDEAQAFVVIGYGFNDPHLHNRIRERVQDQDCPLIVMTLGLEEAEISRLRKIGTRVWCIVAPKKPDGKSDVSRTVVYMPGHDDTYVLDGEQLWSCNSFAERILGG